ncbi:MAG: hypothetical protein AAFU72_04300 [Pseudomonadota bacterium]
MRLIVILFASLIAARAEAVVTFFNDETAFGAATSGLDFTLEEFTENIAPAPSITFETGVVSTISGGLLISNRVIFEIYVNRIDGDGDEAAETIVWTFPEPVVAAGWTYFSTASDTLNVAVDGETRALRDSTNNDPESGFFGFTTTTPQRSISFDTFSDTEAIVFSFDNLQFATGATVPLPGALPFLLAGLAGLALVRGHGRWREG